MAKLVLKTEAVEEVRVLSVEEISLIGGARKAEAELLSAKANDAGKFSKSSAVEEAGYANMKVE
ncbi:MAG: hypothetical protein ACKVP3_23720 [Hyphomicrobiaceae bacterium]